MKAVIAAVLFVVLASVAAKKIDSLQEQLTATEAYSEHLAKSLRECEAGK